MFFVVLCLRIYAVGMVKQPTAEQTEFQMSSEDFPALPGTQLNDGIMSSAASQGMTMNHNSGKFYKQFMRHAFWAGNQLFPSLFDNSESSWWK